MRTRFLLLFICCCVAAHAQQFTGLPAGHYTAIQAMPTNPAWVNNAANGTEINVFSASALAGTNAFRFVKDYVSGGFAGGGVEGRDYYKDNRKGKKHFWGNIDAIGPSVSFNLKEGMNLGFYTRTRQIVRAGNIDLNTSRLIGDLAQDSFPVKASIKNAGFTTHSFAEVGATYGRVLFDDYYRVLKGGVTVKYLMGLSAGTLFTTSTDVVKNKPDSLNSAKGDFTVAYSDNVKPYINNDFSDDIASWPNRGGGGNLGFDIGAVYEYHPEGDPNHETQYLYSISASITDIGSITYRADTGSGQYKLNVRNKAEWQFNKSIYETIPDYLGRLTADTMLKRDKEIDAFRVGLPTALRVNLDYNVMPDFWVSVNVLLNMRGSSAIYNSGYVSTLNITPRYQNKWLTIGLPITYAGYQSMTIGAMLQFGPLYLGSTSILSTVLAKEVRNVDGFAGISLKFPKKNKHYY